jgi:hypothetical protein
MYRKLITKLRITEYSLLIEKGRHLNIPREQRLCSHCKCIDNEKHFQYKFKFKFKFKISLSLNNTLCDNYTNKHVTKRI